MPRKARKIAEMYEIVAAAMPLPTVCDGITCFDMQCERCWGILEDMDRLLDPAPGVTVDLDDPTYAALRDVARRQGTTVAAVAQGVLRQWAAGKRPPPPYPPPD
jgi:hypothetical protein